MLSSSHDAPGDLENSHLDCRPSRSVVAQRQRHSVAKSLAPVLNVECVWHACCSELLDLFCHYKKSTRPLWTIAGFFFVTCLAVGSGNGTVVRPLRQLPMYRLLTLSRAGATQFTTDFCPWQTTRFFLRSLSRGRANSIPLSSARFKAKAPDLRRSTALCWKWKL